MPTKKLKTPEQYLNIQNGNEYILKSEILREERKEEYQAVATLYTYRIINLEEAIKIREKIINNYIKKRLKQL